VRRAARIVVVAAFLAPLSAHAQRASPVEGGGSFNDAPILADGLYSDTIRAGENLYYAMQLAAGQRMRVKATIRPGIGTVGTDVTSFAELQIYESNRERHFGGKDQDIDDLFRYPITLGVRSGTAGDPSALTEAAPGTWFVELGMPRSAAVRRAELRVQLQVEVLGAAVEQPSPTPTDTPEPSPTEPSPNASADRGGGSALPPGEDEGSNFTALFLAMFLLGLLGGAALEVVRGARARP
jgi:hypothetical protein